jgi:hypothetical protein
VPAAQDPCGTHCPALIVAEYLPAGHGLQIWSESEVPDVETNVPTWQTAQGLHSVALSDELNSPAGHAVHARSPVDDPGLPT